MFYSPRLRLKINRAQATRTLLPCDNRAMSVALAVRSGRTGRGARAAQIYLTRPRLGGCVGGQSTRLTRTLPQILFRCFLKPMFENPLAHPGWGCWSGLCSRAGRWGRFSVLLSEIKSITQPAKPQRLFRPAVFCLFLKHPSQAVLFRLTKSSFLYCRLVFPYIRGQVSLEVWLYISGKTVSELGCWCAAPTVAEPSFVNRLLQSFIWLQILWCFAVLRGSLLGELNELSSFQVIKLLESEKILLFWEEKCSNLSKYKVTRAHRIWGPLGLP